MTPMRATKTSMLVCEDCRQQGDANDGSGSLAIFTSKERSRHARRRCRLMPPPLALLLPLLLHCARPLHASASQANKLVRSVCGRRGG